MDDEPQTKRSFSPWLRWGYGFDLILRTVLVLAVLIMLNYLAGRWYERLPLSPQSRQPLSARTTGLLRSITNEIKVTLYFDRSDVLYTLADSLLDNYREVNPRLQITTVDYLRDAGAAVKIKEQYQAQGLSDVGTNKNLIIFDCEGRVKVVNGQELAQYSTERVRGSTENEYSKRLAFHGESLFTAALIYVLNPKPFKAFYLVGHGEPLLEDSGPNGYRSFLSVLAQNRIQPEEGTLIGTNTVPTDCNLLIVAGPKNLSEAEQGKIDDYLRQGGRMLALFSDGYRSQPSGLEKVMAQWGVTSLHTPVMDPKLTMGKGDIMVGKDGLSSHPVTNPLKDSALHLILPQPVGKLNTGAPLADAPTVEVIAYTSPSGQLGRGSDRTPRIFPLAVAVEKGNVKGVITERGTTRIVAVGDALFLNNLYIVSGGNKDFAHYAVNWLLERTQLLQGMGPRPVAEYRLNLAAGQRFTLQWLLLGAIPGGVLLFGGLVWLRRRK